MSPLLPARPCEGAALTNPQGPLPSQPPIQGIVDPTLRKPDARIQTGRCSGGPGEGGLVGPRACALMLSPLDEEAGGKSPPSDPHRICFPPQRPVSPGLPHRRECGSPALHKDPQAPASLKVQAESSPQATGSPSPPQHTATRNKNAGLQTGPLGEDERGSSLPAEPRGLLRG